MPFSVIESSVRVFERQLGSLDRIIDRAVAHATARRIDPQALLGARLFPDMFPLTRQVQVATDHAKGASARLGGVAVPRFEDTETTFEELKARIRKTRDFIGAIAPAGFEGAETRDVEFVRRGEKVLMPGSEYLFTQALPNFFFHVTAAYAILRHNGVELGKRDYLGS
jgi:hypothetical protein